LGTRSHQADTHGALRPAGRFDASSTPPSSHRYAGVFAPNSRWRPLVAICAGPDPALAIRLQRAAKEMGLSEQFGVGTDEFDKSDESAQFATINCGKIDADTTGAKTPFHLEQKQNCRSSGKANRKASIMWALLMARIFEVMPLKCPHCSSPMKVVSFITEPATIKKILSHHS